MKRKKTKSYWVEDTPEKLDYINQTLYEENMKLNKELTKYKRAFEILYDKLQLGVADATKNGAPALFLLLSIGCDQLLDVDEYDLLEELMKDA